MNPLCCEREGSPFVLPFPELLLAGRFPKEELPFRIDGLITFPLQTGGIRNFIIPIWLRVIQILQYFSVTWMMTGILSELIGAGRAF